MSKAHIPPAVAIRGCNTFREKTKLSKISQIFIGEKEKWINKELISNIWLFFCYTIQLNTIKLCTKFQNPNSSSCWEIFDRKKCLYVLYKSGRRKKCKIEKMKAKWGLASLFPFTQYTLPSWRSTQNLKTPAPIGAEKSVTEISIGWKEKWTNKGTGKQYVAVLLLHNTTNHYQALYQISKS